jgi:hypothetical protein
MQETWEDNIGEKEQWGKIEIDRRRSPYIDKEFFEKLLKYSSTCDRELYIHLEDPPSTKTARRKLHKSNIHGTDAIAKLLITESNAQMHK